MELWETPGTGRWIAAIRAGDSIRPLFQAPIATGRVVSVHRGAANILLGDRLVTIAGDSIGGLPNGIAVHGFDGPTLGLREGMPARTHDCCLLIEAAGLTIDVRHAGVWCARVKALPVPADLAARARSLVESARRLPAVGLGPLLGDSAAPARRGGFEVVDYARPAVERMALALEAGNLDLALQEGAGLVGLGPGLTPSGDDLLVGLTAMLTALGDAAARPLAAGWASLAPRRTSLVAATFHRHAADGDYSERLHDLVGAVLAGPIAGIPAAVERAAAWGATSGVDSIVGVAIAMSRRPS